MFHHHVYFKKIVLSLIVVIIVIGFLLYAHRTEPVVVQPVPVFVPKTATVTIPSIQKIQYHTITLATDNASTELAAIVGAQNIQSVEEINRIDTVSMKKGTVLVIPNLFKDLVALSPFPAHIDSAVDIPNLMVVSKTIQAFAIYQSGTLVRWGAVNSGKQSTPTPAGLYFANWKGKTVTSSEDDTWILPWYVNLDNTNGVSMHQYQLPGYPASHACVRLLEPDAEWIYNWVDQWTVSTDGQTVLTYGTPVIVFGAYNFNKIAPWKKLPQDPTITTISSAVLNATVLAYKATIVARASVTAQ